MIVRSFVRRLLNAIVRDFAPIRKGIIAAGIVSESLLDA